MSTTIRSGNFLKAAHRAIHSGNKSEAQRYLKLVLRDDPKNVTAWLWLAGVTPSPQKARGYIARAEMLQPDHPAVEKAKKWVDKKHPLTHQQPHKPINKSPNQSQLQNSQNKRPFSPLTTTLLRGSMVVIMILILGGLGWFVWQHGDLVQDIGKQSG